MPGKKKSVKLAPPSGVTGSANGKTESWMDTQTRVFTNWVNDRLKKTDVRVQSLAKDVADGYVLVKLLETLSGKNVPGKVQKKPKNPIQRQQNLAIAFEFMKEEELPVLNITPEDLEGNQIKLLELIWHLIVRYQISPSERKPSSLLLNCLRRCLPEKEFTNLTSDWRDGFLLSSLVNFCDSALIIDHLYLDADDAYDNLRNAMQLAEEHLNVPRLLRPEDFLSNRPDENCIMTYLSYFLCQGPNSPVQRMYLDWIQEQTGNKTVTNFGDCWLSGRNLGLLVHAVSPEGFQEHGELEWRNKTEDCTLVMELADKLLGVDMALSPQQFLDVSLNHVERLTYLLPFYFASRQEHVVHELHVPEEAGRGATVRLDLRLPEDSTKSIDVVVQGKLTGEVPATSESLPDGRRRVSFDAEIPDRYYLAVSVGGVRLKGSPFTVDLTPTDPDGVELAEQVLPTKAGIPVVLVFRSKDTRRGKLTAEVTGELSGTVPHMISVPSQNTYKLSFIPTESETFTVDVRLDGLHTRGSPFTVSLDGLVQPERIAVGRPRKTVVGELVTIPVDTREAGNDRLTAKCVGVASGGEVEVSLLPPDDPTQIVFTPPVEDTYAVSIFFGSTEVMGSPLEVKVGLVPSDAKQVRLTRPPAGSVSPGTQIKVGFDTSEAGPGKMEASCVGQYCGDIDVDVTQVGADSYDVVFTPTESDVYEIVVTWEGEPVPGSPFNMNLIPRDAPDASKCKLVGFPDSSAILLANEELRFTVDTTGAGVGYLDVVIQVEHPGADENEDDRVSMISTGTRGSEVGTVEDGGEEEEESGGGGGGGVGGGGGGGGEGSLQPIHEDEEEVGQGESDEPPLQQQHSAVDTEQSPHHATGTPQDAEQFEEEEEEEEGEEEEEEVAIRPVPKLSIEPSKENPKLYHVSYVPVEGGSHLLNVYWSDQPLPNSPFGLSISEPTLVEQGTLASVRVKTAYKRKHLKTKLQTRDGTVIAKPNIKMDKITAGDYVLVFTPQHLGVYMLHVTAKNKPVKGSPFIIKYYKPEITEEDLRMVQVAIDAQGREVALWEKVALRIECKEPGLLDELSVTRKHLDDSEEGAGTGAESGDQAPVTLERKAGYVTVTFTPESPGEEEVEVRIAGKPVPGSPFRFSAVAPDVPPLNSPDPEAPVVEAPPKPRRTAPMRRAGSIFGIDFEEQRFVTGTPSKFKLFCGDLGEGDLTVLCKPSSHAEVLVEADKTEDKVFWVTVTPRKAGKCELLMRFGGTEIHGSPFPVTVLPRGNAKKCVLVDKSDCPQPQGNEKLFCVSTKGAGKGKLTAFMKSILNGKRIDVSVDQHIKNHYHIKFMPTEGLNYMLTIRFDEVDINGSPYKILLGSPVHCRAEGEGLDQPWAGRINKFHVDSTNAGPGGLSVLLEREDDDDARNVKVEAEVTKVGEFTYEVTYNPPVPGIYWITVKWSEQNIGGSPFKSICKKPLEPGQFSVQDLVPFTHAEKPREWVVVADHVIEETDKLTVSVLGAEDGQKHSADVSRRDDRSYTVGLHPLPLGKYLVHIFWDRQHVRGSPYRITAISQPQLDQFKMEASETSEGDLSMLVTGPEFAFQLGQLTANLQRPKQTGEEEEEAEEREDVPFHITPLPGNTQCSVTFKPAGVGEYRLALRYDGKHLTGSPFSLVSTDASHCYHSGRGLVSAQIHQSNHFVVFTENAGPGDIKVEVEAEVENEGDVLLVPAVTPREDCGTTYDVSYISNFTGHYKISVFWDIHHIPGSPFEVVCCDPTRYTIPDPPREGILGCPVKIGVKESTMAPSYEQLSVFARGKDHRRHDGEVRKDADGNYVCTVQPPELGKYLVHVQCNGYEVTGSPFKLRNMPPPVPEKVLASGPGLEDGTVGQKGAFELDVTEAGFGYVSLRVQGPKYGFKVHLTDRKEEGRQKVMAEYNPTHAGKYQISVLWSGQHVPNSPFSVNIEGSSSSETRAVSMQGVQERE